MEEQVRGLEASQLRRAKDLIAKTVGPAQKREAVRFLTEVDARSLRRSCRCVAVSRAAYVPPLDWTVCDAELIDALARRVEEYPSRGFWKWC